MKRVGVVAALVTEARALCSRPPVDGAPAQLDDGTLLAVSGVGFDAADTAAVVLTEAGVDGLISFGLAGGLDPTLAAGHLLLPDQVISAGAEALSTDPDWRRRMQQALPPALATSAGKLWTSRTPILTVEGKRRLFADSGAAAVDMEGLAVARAARAAGVPFLAVKVIVDTAADTLPGAVMSADRYGRIQPARLVATLLRHPSQIAALVRLAARYGPAHRALRVAAAVTVMRQANA